MLQGLALVASRRRYGPLCQRMGLLLDSAIQLIGQKAVASEQTNTREFVDIRLDTNRYSHSRRNGCRPLFWA
jgi:hypothetical protein